MKKGILLMIMVTCLSCQSENLIINNNQKITEKSEYALLDSINDDNFTVQVDTAGIYQFEFKFNKEFESCYMVLVNQTVGSTIKTFNHGNSSKNEDGYCTFIYQSYLTSGDNHLKLYLSNKVEYLKIKSLRYKMIKKVDVVSNFLIDGWSTNVTNECGIKTIRLVQVNSDEYTVTSYLNIEKSGYYDLSYFGSAANNGEIYLDIYKEQKMYRKLCSLGLEWTTRQWQRDYISDGNYHVCLYTDNLYVLDEENPKNTIDNPYVYLESGTYQLSVCAPKIIYNSQVYFGGAIFATYID